MWPVLIILIGAALAALVYTALTGPEMVRGAWGQLDARPDDSLVDGE